MPLWSVNEVGIASLTCGRITILVHQVTYQVGWYLSSYDLHLNEIPLHGADLVASEAEATEILRDKLMQAFAELDKVGCL